MDGKVGTCEGLVFIMTQKLSQVIPTAPGGERQGKVDTGRPVNVIITLTWDAQDKSAIAMFGSAIEQANQSMDANADYSPGKRQLS